MNKTVLAAAVTTALAVGTPGLANASIYASSGLDVQNLTVVLDPLSGASVSTFEFTATNTATLNGISSPVQSATCGGSLAINDCSLLSPVLDPLAANAPGGTILRSNNDFSLFGPGLNTYANADSVITAAQLVQGSPSSTRQIAEGEIQGTGTARSNAEITSNTGFTFTFTLTTPGTLTLDFDADPELRAYIDQLAFINGSAQANMTATFALTADDGSGSVNWSPQGTVANDCVSSIAGVTCAEVSDGADLNRTLSVSSNPADAQYSLLSGWWDFGLLVQGLGAGSYTFSLSALTSESVRANVPEPSILALLGIAFAGMGLRNRRRK